MATAAADAEIIYPPGFDDRWEAETTDKGYLRDVVVRFEDGSRFLVNFIDPVRLAQDLQCEEESGSPYIAEPGMIVVPRVTKESIRRAVEGLSREGFFKNSRPIDGHVGALE